MSCSLSSNLLHYSQCSKKTDRQSVTPEIPVIVQVFCFCMIALQGATMKTFSIAMSQKPGDSATEYIGVTQKKLFLNTKLENKPGE